MGASTAALALTALHLLAACTFAVASEITIEPVPGRILLQEGSTGSPGGYGGYGDYGDYGSKAGRHLLGTEGSAGSYGYGGYGYGSTGRRLAELQDALEPEDPVMEQQAPTAAAAAEEQTAAQVVAAAARQAHAEAFLSPKGTCYCRFDTDFNTFAIADGTCKDALYQRCKDPTAGLSCTWLDEFYGAGMKPGFLGHVLPHEKAITAFLFEDCSPQPPCACSSLRWDGNDEVAATVACCRDLKAACKGPFSALSCKAVDAYCRDDKQQLVVAHWVSHALRGADCSAYSGRAYNFMSLKDAHKAVAKQAHAAAASKLVHTAAAPQSKGMAADQLLSVLASDGHQQAFNSQAHPEQQLPLFRIIGAGMLGVAVVAAIATVVARLTPSSGEGDFQVDELLPGPSAAVAAMGSSNGGHASLRDPLLPPPSTAGVLPTFYRPTATPPLSRSPSQVTLADEH